MRSGWRIAAFGLLLVDVAGCDHPLLRTQRTIPPPPPATAPSQPPSQMAEQIPVMPELPAVTDERPIRLDASVPEQQAPPPPAEHRRILRRKPHNTTPEPSQETAKAPTPAPPNPAVASGPPPDESPIGQLSPATSNANTADRQALTDELNTTEKSLNGIHRSLNSEERKTAELIRTFIGKARQALKTDDLDGAKNYSTKAKILLDELVKS
jgi:hypothetical protein